MDFFRKPQTHCCAVLNMGFCTVCNVALVSLGMNKAGMLASDTPSSRVSLPFVCQESLSWRSQVLWNSLVRYHGNFPIQMLSYRMVIFFLVNNFQYNTVH